MIWLGLLEYAAWCALCLGVYKWLDKLIERGIIGFR